MHESSGYLFLIGRGVKVSTSAFSGDDLEWDKFHEELTMQKRTKAPSPASRRRVCSHLRLHTQYATASAYSFGYRFRVSRCGKLIRPSEESDELMINQHIQPFRLCTVSAGIV